MCKRLVFLLCLGLAVIGFSPGQALGLSYNIRIASGSDDAEQHLTAGMDVTSTDTELPYEDDGTPSATDEQLACLRFIVPIPKGAKINKAYVEFTCDETKGGTRPVNLIIEGQLAVNPPAFTTNANDLTGRAPWTAAKVAWSVENWTTVGQKSQTPSLTAIIQEITNQNGWASGNALVLAFRDDKSKPSTGIRCADAYEDSTTTCALLHIEISTPDATSPSPANGATGVSMALFSWSAGDGAVLHNVYFGTSKDLTDTDLAAKNQPFAMYFHVPGIVPGVTYYWRVDEIDVAGKVTTGTVWSFTAASQKAYDPQPKSGAKYVATDAKLTWTAGYGGQFHSVYFGTSFDDVNNASGGKPQADATYTPAGPLAKGTMYYWRVDESDATGKTVYQGDVWSFTTMPDIKITNPDLVGWWTFDEGAGKTAIDFSGHGNDGTLGGGVTRIDGVVGGALQLANGYVIIDAVANDIKSTNLSLSAWIKTTQSGTGYVFGGNDSSGGHPLLFGIASGGIYVYDDATGTTYPPAVNDNQWHMITYVRSGGTGYVYLDGVQTATYSSTFSLSTVTLWSIGMEWDPPSPSDFFNGSVDDVRIYNKSLTAAEVKELMRGDPALAWKPSPDDKATVDVVKIAQGLSWAAGNDATQHDVYFGTDKAAVESATVSDKTGIYRGRQAQASYTPTEELAWGTGPHYWRIDEVQANGTVTAGAVWSFTVANFLIVDDMESYTDDEGSRIYEIWIDGWTNNTGSVVGNLTSPFAEHTIIHGGLQSMPMDYNNTKTPFYSEAELDFAPVQNWTANNVTDLSVWFRGRAVAYVDKGNGAFTVSGSGHDIWDNADDFRFVYKKLSGNGSIAVKVESLANTNVWAKAGVMIRDNLDGGSQMAYMIQSYSSGVSFGWRQNAGATCGSSTVAGIVAPQWVKLTRTGNAFTAQYSADGKTWTDIKDATTGAVVSTNITMGASIYIGLCVTSHDAALTTTAQFSGAATTGGVTGAWTVAAIGDDPEPANTPDTLYLAVGDSAGKVAVVKNTDPAALTTATWTEWKVPLSSLTGINLGKVKALYVGVGDRKNPVTGGAGRLYIDDIRLTRP